MIILEVLLCLAGAVLMVHTLVLFAEVLFALRPRKAVAMQEGERQSVTILTPAHNEAPIIAETLRSIFQQLTQSDRLIVIADNCTDATATIAAAEGADVLVRNDVENRGKAFALDFAIQHLANEAPETVIIIDADCRLAPGSIDRLVRQSARTGRPAQALYLIQAPKNSGLKLRIAEFAYVVKNLVRPAGLHRLGLPCQLMGTGTAFPWSCISAARIANHHLAEDYKLGIDLACAGAPPIFCPEAVVTSAFPTTNEGALGQRTRWEHGHIALAIWAAPRLVLQSLLKHDVRLMAMALDIGVPPLALLTLQIAAVWLASALWFGLANVEAPLVIASTTAVLLLLSILLSWVRYGRAIISLGKLALVPVYVLWKIPMYLKFIVARQKVWLRTTRDHEVAEHYDKAEPKVS